jgi:hypothetical protein
VTPEGRDHRYARAIEAAWSKLSGRPAVLSPREFESIESWRRRGIPLSVVLEAMSDAGRRAGRLPRSLRGLGPAVDEAFAAIAGGRTLRSVTPSPPPRTEARRAWEDALARCGRESSLGALLARLLVEEQGGADPEGLDATLDAALREVVTAEELRAVEEETRRRLAAFRGRMSGEDLAATEERALLEQLRQRLGLPRMSLTR